MNEITKWFSHPLYRWMDEEKYESMDKVLKRNCTEEYIKKILNHYDNISFKELHFYPAGTYSEPEKTVLDNIDAFYEIRMEQKVSKNHVAQFRVYLPVKWNYRFMGISGAGTNTEVDWFSSIRFNVISWPMALNNGYACAVTDTDTGIRLDCSWGFDKTGEIEWEHIDAWAFHSMHEMTVCAKEILEAVYNMPPIASYMHGTSGGGREVVTEAILYPNDYDGLWADAPSIDLVNLSFTCIWAAVVEANEKHIVPLSKYIAARDISMRDPVLREHPFNRQHICWMDFLNHLCGLETEDGPITRKDIAVMVKTWEGPVLPDGRRIAYGFGPIIRQWPLPNGNPLYGYFQRREDGKYNLMPIAEQYIRWFVKNPNFDIHTCSYEKFAQIYDSCHARFDRYSFNECDYTPYARSGGKLIITQGTGDCVVPYQQMIDYYRNAFDYFPSEKIMNDTIRLFMPPLAGHSILDWSGPAVSIADGMTALTNWVEKGIAPECLPTQRYDFVRDCAVEKSSVQVYDQWQYTARQQQK